METLLAKPHDGNLGVSPYCKVRQCNTTAKELDFHRVILLENESSVYSSLSDPTRQITHVANVHLGAMPCCKHDLQEEIHDLGVLCNCDTECMTLMF